MLCIRNGLLILPGGIREADLYIRGDRIFSVGGHLAGCEVLDAGGCWVLPGFIDGSGTATKGAELAEYTERALLQGFTTVGWQSGDGEAWRGRASVDLYPIEKAAPPEERPEPSAVLVEAAKRGAAGLGDALRTLCETPARAAALYPGKGALRAGSEADIVVWDPDWRSEAAGMLRDERSAPGRARHVLLRGMLIVSRGNLLRYAQGRFRDGAES